MNARRPASAHLTLSALWDWLFPPRCVACNARGAWLCPTCLAQIKYFSTSWQPDGQDIAPLQDAQAAARLEGPLRKAIHEFKYQGMRVLAEELGDILHKGWCVKPCSAEIIVPVPLHPSRLRERGYNQSALLSRQLSRRTGLPVVEAVLERIAPTRPQVGLSAKERADNVRNAFSCVDPGLPGANVLLVDDVWTTGATMRACGQALLLAGVQAVWGLTLARG
jgi:ComF family protein